MQACLKCDCDASGQENGIFRKILKTYGDLLDWVCEHPTNLDKTSSFGLKWKPGCLGLGRVYKQGGFEEFGGPPGAAI
jgi:hypothetical protein